MEVAFNDPGVGVFGLHNAVMPVGNQFVEVVAPIKEGTAAGRYLDRRKGDGGYMVILQCGDDHAARKARLGDELGVRFALAQDGKEYHILQLHPADTGGSFLEVDQQIGGEDMDDRAMGAGRPRLAARAADRARSTGSPRRSSRPTIRPGSPPAGRICWSSTSPTTSQAHAGQRHDRVRRGHRRPRRGPRRAASPRREAAPRELDICGMHITIEAAPGA